MNNQIKSKALRSMADQVSREMENMKKLEKLGQEFNPADHYKYSLQRIKAVLIHIADFDVQEEIREAFKAGFREAKNSYQGKDLDQLFHEYKNQKS